MTNDILLVAPEMGISKDMAPLYEPVLNDSQFNTCPASIGGHHSSNGGLLQHTKEVIALCLFNSGAMRKYTFDKRVLFLGALWHDFGKTCDYVCENGEWRKSKHCREIHHISRAAVEWSIVARNSKIYPELENPVLHCILSHHECREYGSPVMPKSREAWLIAICDKMSARMDDCEKIDQLNVDKRAAP